MTADGGAKEQALAGEILADARRQAERKLAQARRRGDRALEAARAKGTETEQRVLAAAAERLERDRARMLADIAHQEQVRTLQVKDEVIQELFTQALETLRQRKGDVLRVLVRLSVDAIAHLPGDRLELEVARLDAESFSAALGEQVAAGVRAAHGRGVRIEVVASDELPAGGVIVRSAEGRMIDNSFAARMRRTAPALRDRIAELIFGESSA